jgi:hypothetical protein
MREFGSIPDRCKIIFLFPTASRPALDHPSSNPVDTGRREWEFLGIKRPRREADQPPPLSVELYVHSPIRRQVTLN